MTMGEMVKEIYNATAGKYTKTAAIQNIGTAKGSSTTIGVATFAPQYYDQLTADNFYIVINSVPSGTTGIGSQTAKFRGRYSGFNVGKSYNPKSGILTITGLYSEAYLWGGNGDYSVMTVGINITATVYLIVSE